MGKPHKVKFTGLNRYSWSIIIAFISTAFAMQYHTASSFLEDFLQTLPLIVITVYWCEKSAPLITLPENNLKKIELFRRDFFILSFSFLLGCLISLIFAYDNSDARGLWSFIIYFFTSYGLVFSTIFSASAQLIKNHKTYTIIFSLLIITLISLEDLFPHYIHVPFLGSIDTFYVVTCALLIIHLLFCSVYQSISIFKIQR